MTSIIGSIIWFIKQMPVPFRVFLIVTTFILVFALLDYTVVKWRHRKATVTEESMLKNNKNRIGIRMKRGRGAFERTKIRRMNTSIDTNGTELDMKDTDIG